MSVNKTIVGGFIFCVGAGVALGCAFDEPNRLLVTRENTLKAPIANSFAFEVNRLSNPVTDTLKSFGEYYPQHYYQSEVTNKYYTGKEADEQERIETESKGLTVEQSALLQQVKKLETEKAVLASGANLPKAVLLYAAGAVDFRNGQMESAAERFKAVLDLPEDQRAIRATFAAYTLGRIMAGRGDTEKAAQYFEQTRDFARKGAPDPYGSLAVASYGEEARLHFRHAKKLTETGQVPGTGDADYTKELSTAISLYTEQSLRSSNSGTWSLRVVLQHILADEKRIKVAVEEPVIQRLLVAYILASFWTEITDPDVHQHSEPTSGLELLDILTDAANRHPDGWLADSAQLATLAYREGKYDVARRLTAKSTGPLASWLNAKLALQTGDVSAATAFYADAAKAFPTIGDKSPLDSQNRALMFGETGVLALARGEYLKALEYLYNSGDYWSDTAYVAERVVGVDELKSFVDAQGELTESNVDLRDLRDLLARRLMRLGRYQDAIPYFWTPETRKHAIDYVAALKGAQKNWTSIGRAEDWYKAASLARFSGMEIMGTEGPPDYRYYNGEALMSDPEQEGAFVTAEEKQRNRVPTAQPDERFHYRYVAVDHAVKAAQLLPPKSQAYAAILCNAAHWMESSGAQDKSWELYQLYVKNGAVVPWATHFGHRCPNPEFDAASATYRKQLYRQARHFVSVHRIGFAAGGAIGVASVVCIVLWRRRRNR